LRGTCFIPELVPVTVASHNHEAKAAVDSSTEENVGVVRSLGTKREDVLILSPIRRLRTPLDMATVWDSLSALLDPSGAFSLWFLLDLFSLGGCTLFFVFIVKAPGKYDVSCRRGQLLLHHLHQAVLAMGWRGGYGLACIKRACNSSPAKSPYFSTTSLDFSITRIEARLIQELWAG
jgi:hypothetical protein